MYNSLDRYIAGILEEWDMKEPPNSYTGYNYEEIAHDLRTRIFEFLAVEDL